MSTANDSFEVPARLRQALRTDAAEGTHTVSGVHVAYREWGRGQSSCVVLVHGSAANAHWWDHIGPLLASNHHVLAVDLSGHGNSDHRSVYSQDRWAHEVESVVNFVGLSGCVLVAHSMGGKVAYRAARNGLDAKLSGLVILDSDIANTPPARRVERVIARGSRPQRVYMDKDSAVDAFRPFGDATPPLDLIRRHVGVRSIKEVSGGWTWKFDPKIFYAVTEGLSEIRSLACPTEVIRAEHGSVISDWGAEKLMTGLGSSGHMEVLAGSGHHMLLDASVPQLVERLSCILANLTLDQGRRQ